MHSSAMYSDSYGDAVIKRVGELSGGHLHRLTRRGRAQLAAGRRRWQFVDQMLHRIWMKASPA